MMETSRQPSCQGQTRTLCTMQVEDHSSNMLQPKEKFHPRDFSTFDVFGNLVRMPKVTGAEHSRAARARRARASVEGPLSQKSPDWRSLELPPLRTHRHSKQK